MKFISIRIKKIGNVLWRNLMVRSRNIFTSSAIPTARRRFTQHFYGVLMWPTRINYTEVIM